MHIEGYREEGTTSEFMAPPGVGGHITTPEQVSSGLTKVFFLSILTSFIKNISNMVFDPSHFCASEK